MTDLVLEICVRDEPPRLVTLNAPVVRIGRDASMQVQLPDVTVSSRHAVIENKPTGVFVTDMGSSSGTFLNDERVADRTPLGHGDTIRIGQVRIRVGIGGPPPVQAGAAAQTLPPPRRPHTPLPFPAVAPPPIPDVSVPAVKQALPEDRDTPPEIPFKPEVGGEARAVELEIPFAFAFDSHYDVLGVSMRASTDQITDAKFAMVKLYDRLAKQGDETASQRMVQVTTAQEVLTKKDKRAEYDRRAETRFLSIHDPAVEERLEWADGLELLRELTMAAGDRDPLAAPAPAGDELESPIVDELLK